MPSWLLHPKLTILLSSEVFSRCIGRQFFLLRYIPLMSRELIKEKNKLEHCGTKQEVTNEEVNNRDFTESTFTNQAAVLSRISDTWLRTSFSRV